MKNMKYLHAVILCFLFSLTACAVINTRSQCVETATQETRERYQTCSTYSTFGECAAYTNTNVPISRTVCVKDVCNEGYSKNDKGKCVSPSEAAEEAANPDTIPAKKAVSEPLATIDQLKANAENGDAESQYLLGIQYSKGDNIPQDKIKAYMWFHLSAEQDYILAESLRYKLSTTMTQDEVAEAKRLAAAFSNRRAE